MNSKVALFSALLLAVCLTQVAVDIYAPALIAIADDFDASIMNVQRSMSIYMVGVAISQLIYGPVSEGIGRKKPLILGLVIMLVGCIICLNSTNINMLITGRFVQGAGAGACAALWRSIFRDSFSGEELSTYGSYLGTVVKFVIPAAPLLGSYLLINFGWVANFIFMGFYTIVALICIMFFFSETNKTFHTNNLRLTYVIHNYSRLIKCRLFMGITFSTFLTYGAFFSWFVTGPVLLIKNIGITPLYFGWLNFLSAAFACGTAAWLNGKYVKKFGINKCLRFGWSMVLLSGVAMLLGKYLLGFNVLALMIPIVILFFGVTFIWPNLFARAFTPYGDIAGYAGSLYGFMQVIGWAAVSTIITILPADDQGVFAIMIIICASLAWLVYEQVALINK